MIAYSFKVFPTLLQTILKQYVKQRYLFNEENDFITFGQLPI